MEPPEGQDSPTAAPAASVWRNKICSSCSAEISNRALTCKHCKAQQVLPDRPAQKPRQGPVSYVASFLSSLVRSPPGKASKRQRTAPASALNEPHAASSSAPAAATTAGDSEPCSEPRTREHTPLADYEPGGGWDSWDAAWQGAEPSAGAAQRGAAAQTEHTHAAEVSGDRYDQYLAGVLVKNGSFWVAAASQQGVTVTAVAGFEDVEGVILLNVRPTVLCTAQL